MNKEMRDKYWGLAEDMFDFFEKWEEDRDFWAGSEGKEYEDMIEEIIQVLVNTPEKLVDLMDRIISNLSAEDIDHIRETKDMMIRVLDSIEEQEKHIATFKSLRQQAGMTQAEISDLLDIPLRTWESWESGARKPAEWARKLITAKMVGIIDGLKEVPDPITKLHYSRDLTIEFEDLEEAKHYYLTWDTLKDLIEDPDVKADAIANEVNRMQAISEAIDLEELADVLNEYKWVSGDSGDWFTCEY